MPHVYAHNKMAELVKDNLSDSARILIDKHEQVYSAGALGPDPFFVLPSLKNTGLGYKIGSALHKNQTGASMSSFIDTAMDEQNDRDLLFAYIAGYLCHYSLDCAAHPYVLYMAGKGIGHAQFETYIDAELMHYYGTDKNKSPQHQFIAISEYDALKVGKLFETALSDIYGIHIKDKDYYKAIRTMKRAQKMTHDKKGRKIKTLGAIEKVIRKPYVLTCVICPSRSVQNALNKYNQPWCLPWDNSNIKTDSFLDIQKRAIEEASTYVTALYSAMYVQQKAEAVKKLIGSRSFETGVSCEEKKQLMHCKNAILTAH